MQLILLNTTEKFVSYEVKLVFFCLLGKLAVKYSRAGKNDIQ